MLILAIETTGSRASAAIGDHETGTIAEMTSDEEMNHLKGLTSMIDVLMRENGVCAKDIGCIAVSEGPGSFTGIRIGVSTARALAQAWKIKTLAVPTLAAFVHNLPDYRGMICPIFDARRNQVYGGVYILNEGDAATVVPAGSWDLRELLGAIGDKMAIARCKDGFRVSSSGYKDDAKITSAAEQAEIKFFGDGLAVYGNLIEEWVRTWPPPEKEWLAPEKDRFQKASSVLRLAFGLLKKGETHDYSALMPVYLRKAEAERKLELRLQEEAERITKGS